MASFLNWLVPAPGSDRDRLADTIEVLAEKCAAPRFQPHITIVGGVDLGEDEALRSLDLVAVVTGPFDVRFTALEHEQDYFRSLYLRAEPSPKLTALHQAARRAYSLKTPPYVPHLSLLYADLSEQQKQPLIDAVDLPMPLVVRFDAAELWLAREPGVQSWRRVTKTPLSGP